MLAVAGRIQLAFTSNENQKKNSTQKWKENFISQGKQESKRGDRHCTLSVHSSFQAKYGSIIALFKSNLWETF